MKTSRSFEIVTYNTTEFLETKIKDLKKAKIISFAFWIKHTPDTDEKKAHNHIYVIPSKMLQTDDICEEFIELDPEHPDKPFTGRVERTSNYDFSTGKWDDALLYSIHDKIYLQNKGLTRNIHYKWEDLKSTDDDMLQALINRITPWAEKPIEKLIQAVKDGETDLAAMKAAGIPMQQAAAAMTWIRAAQRENLAYLPDRGVKHSHSERQVCCEVCGEIKSIKEFPYLTVTTDIHGNDFGTCFACLWREANKGGKQKKKK